MTMTRRSLLSGLGVGVLSLMGLPALAQEDPFAKLGPERLLPHEALKAVWPAWSKIRKAIQENDPTASHKKVAAIFDLMLQEMFGTRNVMFAFTDDNIIRYAGTQKRGEWTYAVFVLKEPIELEEPDYDEDGGYRKDANGQFIRRRVQTNILDNPIWLGTNI